jgi:hypothetical protein
MGFFAGGLLSSAANNSYFGYLAGQRLVGPSNTGIGHAALGSGTGGVGESNTAVGSSALGTLTGGFENVAVGREAGFALTTGGQNVAVGAYAMSAATTNGSNVAVGSNALLLDAVGSRSVAVGFEALRNQAPVAATNMNNVAVGHSAARGLTTGTGNTAVGVGALAGAVTSSNNTCIGLDAGNLITAAADCVIIGQDADVQFTGVASSNSIVIGKGAVGIGANGITLGNASTADIRFGTSLTSLPNPGINFSLGASSRMQIGHTSATTSAPFIGFIQAGAQDGSIAGNGAGGTNYNTTSDYRLKTEVAPLVGASERLALLKPCSFRMSDVIQEGFIAHEVQEVVPLAVFGVKDAVDDHGAPLYQGLDQSRLVPLLTAACQELAAKADAATARAIEAERRLDALEAAFNSLIDGV